ncbi:MAG: hypothetical protein ACI8UG_000881 [Gammaproteobacteria bacterium]|jgi:hypothetical protein
MPIPQQLLEAIIATQDNFDDTPRRVAEQWLTKNSQAARGELIDLQLSLAIMSYNPSENTVALDSQLNFLLESQGQNFIQFDGLAEYVEDYTYHRGFVEHIKLSAKNFLQHAPTLFSLAPIYHIDLTDVTSVSESLFQSPYLKNITSLSLDRNNLTDENMLQLASSPYLGKLRWLSLMFNSIDIDGAAALAESKSLAKLKYVNFFDNIVDPTEYQAVDQGVILEHILPESGQELEKRCGHVRWLHSKAELERNLSPNRFTIG